MPVRIKLAQSNSTIPSIKCTVTVILGTIAYDKKGDITIVDYVIYRWSKDGKYD